MYGRYLCNNIRYNVRQRGIMPGCSRHVAFAKKYTEHSNRPSAMVYHGGAEFQCIGCQDVVYVLGVLDLTYGTEIKDIIMTTPDQPYTNLKESIGSAFFRRQSRNSWYRRKTRSQDLDSM